MLRRMLMLAIAVAAVSITGCASDRKVIAQANQQQDQLAPAIITDPQVESFMQTIGARIVASAKELDAQGVGPKAHKKGDNDWMFKDVEFHMVNSKTLNAFTTGGHHVYIYSQLFTMAKSEDEFAAVCSHEFAHIYCRHVQQGMNRQMGIMGVAAAAAVGGAAVAGPDNYAQGATAGGTAGLAAGQFIGMGYTRDDENQADQYGFKFYTTAGWDPNHFADFFKSMIAAGYDTTPEIASDHPKLSNRVKNTEKRVADLPPSAKQWRRSDSFSQAQFDAVQARVARLAKNSPKDKQAQAAELMLSAFPSCVAPNDLPDQKTAQQKIMAALQAQKQ